MKHAIPFTHSVKPKHWYPILKKNSFKGILTDFIIEGTLKILEQVSVLFLFGETTCNSIHTDCEAKALATQYQKEFI